MLHSSDVNHKEEGNVGGSFVATPKDGIDVAVTSCVRVRAMNRKSLAVKDGQRRRSQVVVVTGASRCALPHSAPQVRASTHSHHGEANAHFLEINNHNDTSSCCTYSEPLTRGDHPCTGGAASVLCFVNYAVSNSNNYQQCP